VKEACGIAAVYALKNGRPDLDRDVSELVPRLLLDMQMRGELSAGITSYDPRRGRILTTHKDLGTVTEAFRLSIPVKYRRIISRCGGCAAVGHVRYATCGLDDIEYAQPFERTHGRTFKWFAFGFNGQLANYQELRSRIQERKGYHIILDTDTEIMMHYIARALMGEEKPSWHNALAALAREFDGAYTIALINADGDLVVARDPRGFKPTCYAIRDDLFAAASESVALSNLGFTEILSLEPGCYALVNHRGVTIDRYAESPRTAACFFEYVYFANVGSTIDGSSVYMARQRLGQILAELETLPRDKDLIIVPVPDTAKAAADAMGYHLGIPVREGLLRNRYVGRTFIKGENRAQAVSFKYTPVREVLEGKRVILVEDSIVRGTTLRYLLKHLRERGRPKEIHLRVSSPPILNPCFYGIDMSTVGELFARTHVARLEDEVIPEPILASMAKQLGADSLRYVPLGKIPLAIGRPANDLCMACLTARYPTACGQELHARAEEAYKKGAASGRTYETTAPAESGA
jgi:amidophosphoribosyltransferase